MNQDLSLCQEFVSTDNKSMNLFAQLEHICQWTLEIPGINCAMAQAITPKQDAKAVRVQGVNTLRNVLVAVGLILSLAQAKANKVNGFINFQGDTVRSEEHTSELQSH